jgi:D-alanyl-D-alanine carboxypeptidase
VKTKAFKINLAGTVLSLAIAVFLLPLSQAYALSMPTNGNDFIALTQTQLNAKAYIVEDMGTGQVIADNNSSMPWVPASLTKLVTAMVVMDTKPKLTKSVKITALDESRGACSSGGDCINAKPGVAFTIDGLFHAALLPSANNAASALAASTGMSAAQFTAKMNAKAKSLGATGSVFNEPTGMDPNNIITASDYAKIISAAYSNSYLRQVAETQTYLLKSTNNKKYNQTLKNTDKLLSSPGVQMIAAKTGYLDESQYNFASLVKLSNGDNVAIVVLCEPHLYMAFSDTTSLSSIAEQIQSVASSGSLAASASGVVLSGSAFSGDAQ